MQFYEFPIINNIDDIIDVIDNCNEINVHDRNRNGFQVVDYDYVNPNTFPPIPTELGRDRDIAIIRRECRGLLFNSNGDILARRYHKFHNIGEREETLPQNIDFSQPHDVLDKLDGSMVSSFMNPSDQVQWIADQSATYYTGKVFWGTMFGNTDVANGAAKYVSESNYDYEQFARDCMSDGWTPIFEWCSLSNRVVIRHDQEKLILTGIRHNKTGCYKTYNDMVELARFSNIPYVKSFGSVSNPNDFIELVHNKEDIEGYVIRFNSGHSVKIKCDWYCRFHNAIENLVFEKNVWKLVLHDDVDDILPVLMEQDRQHLSDFYSELTAAMESVSKVITEQVIHMQQLSNGDKKIFAILVKDNDNLVGPMKSMAFRINSNYCASIDLVREYAMKCTGSASKIEEARTIICVKPWN